MSAFLHWVAPGVYESRSAVGAGVTGGEKWVFKGKSSGVKRVSYENGTIQRMPPWYNPSKDESI